MQRRGIFFSLFLLQNRLQALFGNGPRNLGGHTQAVFAARHGAPSRHPGERSRVYMPGRAAGCARQNIKTPARKLRPRRGRAVCMALSPAAGQPFAQSAAFHAEMLGTLFACDPLKSFCLSIG